VGVGQAGSLLVDGGVVHARCLAHVFRVASGRVGRHRSAYSARLPGYSIGPEYLSDNEAEGAGPAAPSTMLTDALAYSDTTFIRKAEPQLISSVVRTDRRLS
jgi:hypothetical protein